MQFQSKQAQLFISAASGSIPDIIIATAIAFISGGGLYAFFFVMASLWAIYALLGLKNLIWSWTYFFWRGKRLGSDAILQYLKQRKFPRPKDILDDAESYFEGIIKDTSLAADLRIEAATTMASKNAIAQSG